eukprot:CAMPEP_0170170882 /NCGR_PEP_ID=MMETSP0040_2-20121228/3938_1 /TAXON_ID=641309 /ORGANISM="Lotharella oceanica, Strain CCMP622" /LENGTH=138 /DNA_ID=CAMNT_0010410589 /DNA_START=200 /DNA_END=613 /DNA_ORIENTATION=+
MVLAKPRLWELHLHIRGLVFLDDFRVRWVVVRVMQQRHDTRCVVVMLHVILDEKRRDQGVFGVALFRCTSGAVAKDLIEVLLAHERPIREPPLFDGRGVVVQEHIEDKHVVHADVVAHPRDAALLRRMLVLETVCRHR